MSFRDRGQRALGLLPGSKVDESDSMGSGRHASLDLSTPGLEFLARAAFIAAALYAFHTGVRLFEGSGIWAPAVPLGLVLYTAAASCLMAAFVIRRPGARWAQICIAGLLLVTIVIAVWFEIDYANPTYGTDAMAFAHSAGQVLIQGENPYEEVGGSLGDVIERFNVPDTFVTRTTAGEEIERLVSYPGGHVLTYAGGVAMGLDDLRWVTLAFEVSSLVLIWSVVSPIGRLFIPFALLMEDNLTIFFTSGAVTDWLWVLPLVAAALYLNRERFGYAGLALGLACAMKQQPWFLVPFAVVWVYQTLRSREDSVVSLRDGITVFLGGIASGFLVLNIPFIVWSFRDWIEGVFHPALGDLVPDGQGFSVLTSRGLLPIPGGWYSLTLLLVTAFTLWAYARWFDRMQDLLWVLPPALLLLGARSFHSYFIYWAPVALLWLDLRLNRRTPIEPAISNAGRRSRSSRSFALAAVAVAVGLAVTAILTLATRSIEVGQVAPLVKDGVIRSLRVDITNLSDETLQPIFELYWRGQPVPWVPTEKALVGAHTSSVVVIRPTDGEGIPPVRVTPDGMGVADFRVRVNDSGSSVYASSEVVHVEFDDPVVNPLLGNWVREESVFAAPYGWRAAVHGGTTEQRWIRPAERGAGVLLGVSSNGAGPAEWVETALVQDVASFASCYVWDFDHDLGLRTDGGGSPLAVSGVQVVQEDASLWFVPSDGSDGQTMVLADGTSLVEVAATPGERSSAILDVASQAQGAGIDLERGGIIKLFNAVHETIAARSESITYRLAGGCPGG